MPPSQNETLKELDGPYESWVFGEVGQKHVGVDGALKPKTLVAALAELPAGHPLTNSTGPLTIAAGRVAHCPTLWRRGLPPPGAGRPLFLPLVLEASGGAGRAIDLAGLRNVISALAGLSPAAAVTAVTATNNEAKSVLHRGFRLNAPLPPRCFDAGFAKAPAEPAFAPKAALKQEIAEAAQDGGRPPLAILAVIDDGLAFGHPGLRDRDGETRMEFCWLQGASIAPDAADRTVLFGREHTRASIGRLLAEAAGDEDAFYRAAGSLGGGGMVEPLAGSGSHGAHVAALAAGSRPGAEADLERVRLIGVELPPALVMDSVGFGKDAYILAAFHYVFERADRIAAAYGSGPLPLVINFSFGFTGGPHDGGDRLEQAIAALIAAREPPAERKPEAWQAPTRLVMPAGNHFLAGLHAEITDTSLGKADRYDIPWRIQPNDRTANYLEIWYPLDGSAPGPRIIEIVSPSGRRWRPTGSHTIAEDVPQAVWDLTFGGPIVGQVSMDLFRGRRWRIMVVLAPTETPATPGIDAPAAEAGLWRIGIDAACVRDSEAVITCRIQRDHSVAHPLYLGRQSYFDHPGDRVFGEDGLPLQNDDGAVFVRRFGTLNGLATRPEVRLVAGIVADSAAGPGLPAPYSSAARLAGTAWDTGTITYAAVSEESPALSGVRASGTRAGASGRMGGTSAAAPQMARALALGFLARGVPKAPAGDPVEVGPLPGWVPGLKKLAGGKRPQGDLDLLTARLGRGTVGVEGQEPPASPAGAA